MRLHVEDAAVRSLLFKGGFGLERESLRVTQDGFLALTPNPFVDNPHIVRDFGESQVEINTPVVDSAQAAIQSLREYDAVVQRELAQRGELLWPFSNPPHIRSAADIAIAQYEGDEASKTAYREYLSDRYGRYKMTFSGIHFNYSFASDLLQASFEASGQDDFTAYKDNLYLTLAKRAVAYGWLIVSITAASPLMDRSFAEKGELGGELFMGYSSVRCGEQGYWNFFTPTLNYSSVQAYADSIQRYVDKGFIKYPSELYYPIRIKPRGAYSLDGLRAGDVSHIELRMFDLNPLRQEGLAYEDVFFAQLFLIWLASTPDQPFDQKDQIQAVQNFKNAARYDLKTVNIVVPNGEVYTVARAAKNVIGFMQEFYAGIDAPQEIMDCLAFQLAKFEDNGNRYANIVRQQFAGDFVAKGLELARDRQQAVLA